MTRASRYLGFVLLMGNVASSPATTLYVSADNPSPTPPYTNWNSAATSIQDAIDVGDIGDIIVVSNGVYGPITVDKALAIRSVNGPEAATISGLFTNTSAAACAYLCDGSLLDGFTLRDGISVSDMAGGGVTCESTNVIVTNCVITGNSGRTAGGVHGGALYNCTISSNTVTYYGAGGVDQSVLYYCLLAGNHGYHGGGSQNSELHWCEIRDNTCFTVGGGSHHGTSYNCTYSNNSAGGDGGAASYTTLYNCLIVGNRADFGGGTYSANLYNCTVVGNTASNLAGGISCSTAYNSIIYYNQPDGDQAGWYLFNCCTPQTWTTSGTYITNAPGFVSLDNLRLLADSPCRNAGTNMAWHAASTDLDGMPRVNGTVDIGAYEYWQQTRTGGISIALSASHTIATPGIPLVFVASMSGQVDNCVWDFDDGTTASGNFEASHTFAQTGVYVVSATASNVDGTATDSVSVLICGTDVHVAQDGDDDNNGSDWANAKATIQTAIDDAWPGATRVLVSNGVYNTGGRIASASMTNRVLLDKGLALQSVNGPEATFIEGAPSALGGNGDDAIRCVYMSTGTSMSGFTIMNGHTRRTYIEECTWSPKVGTICRMIDESPGSGGGAFCESPDTIISNCVFLNNSSYFRGGGVLGGKVLNSSFIGNTTEGSGGGVYISAVANCVFDGNSAANTGGAMSHSSAEDCLLLRNSAQSGGGAADSSLLSSTIVSNSGVYSSGTFVCHLDRCIVQGHEDYAAYVTTASNTLFHGNSGNLGIYLTLYFCTIVKNDTPPETFYASNCIIEDETSLADNFVDYDGNDFRLAPNSPFIDAGMSTNGPETDLDGIPRPLDGTGDGIRAYDMGAYEYVHPTADSDGDGLSDADEIHTWKTHPLMNDTDGDGLSERHEIAAGTDPTNAGSFLGIAETLHTGVGRLITWHTVFGKGYWIQLSTDIASGVWSNLWEYPIYEIDEYPEGTESFYDITPLSNHPVLYRIELHN